MIDCTEKPKIVLIAIETKIFSYLEEFIGSKYQLFAVDEIADFDTLYNQKNIELFLMGTDKPWIRNKNVIHKIKTDPLFFNIPVLGLALKQHFPKMPDKEKHMYEDFVLLPCSYEDLLTRIDVWTKTYGVMCDDPEAKRTFSLENFN